MEFPQKYCIKIKYLTLKGIGIILLKILFVYYYTYLLHTTCQLHTTIIGPLLLAMNKSLICRAMCTHRQHKCELNRIPVSSTQ